ncbi:hypothetical protein [Corynebacterium sp. MC3]|uniref:hypothetical protein n=1 Tax=Corynebacterium sp. MC3 TaxID=1720193 RepID=UPI0008D92BA0|nr:hypothetical protein [Corynebacterium sp. MC3]
MANQAKGWRAVITALLAGAVLYGCCYLVGVNNPPEQPVLQGDALGAEQDETAPEYAARAEQSLEEAAQEGEQAHFALVSFGHPLNPEEADAVLRPVGRVNAVITELGANPVGEPAPGASRAEILRGVSAHIEGAVVYDAVAHLADVNDVNDVFAVEVLPADAVWGAFAIRPVSFVDAQ